MSQLHVTFWRRLRQFSSGSLLKMSLAVPVVLLAILCVFYSYTAIAGHSISRQDTLQIVHTVFRHGDRNPTETYKNDPYKNYAWPDGWGALTKKGKSQLYELGSTFRERYRSMFPEDVSTSVVYVRSSDADRCHMSGATFLAGLYPPTPRQLWNSHLDWQPIPIHSLPRNLDNIVAMKKKCPTYEKALEAAYKSQSIQDINNENKELYKFLGEATGQDMSNVTAVEFLYNTLEIEEQNGLELPGWSKDIYPDKLLPLAIRSLEVFTETTFMKRMKGGVLLKDIVEHTKAKQEGRLSTNMFIYSAHDITLINVLNALGLSHNLKPEYGAAFVIEGHSPDVTTNKIALKLYYFKNYATKEPTELKIEQCGEPCYVDDFANIFADIIPKNWEEECKH